MADINDLIDYEDEDEFYSEDDFEFIISAEGDLKSVAIPPHLIDSPPETVKAILDFFGIEDLKEIAKIVLH